MMRYQRSSSYQNVMRSNRYKPILVILLVLLVAFLILRFTGVGGTITTLAAFDARLERFDEAAVTEHVLTRDGLDACVRELHDMGQARKHHPLLRDRHDVILYGALVLCELMDALSIWQITPSVCDGMEGFLRARLSLDNCV